MGIRESSCGTGGIHAATAPRAVMDRRLVAAVQAQAGAHCHEAAGLIQRYYYQLYLWRKADGHDAAEHQSFRAGVEEAEAALRRFLHRGCGLLTFRTPAALAC